MAVAMAAMAMVTTKVTFDEVLIRFSVDVMNEKASDGCRN